MDSKTHNKAFAGKNLQLAITPEYQKWRKDILSITPEQIGVQKEQANTVYGVLLDVGMMDRKTDKVFTLSLAAFANGDASFQPTLGGGVVGLGRDERMANTAKKIIQISQALLKPTLEVPNYWLPNPGFVRFFFLTTNGVRFYGDMLHTIQAKQNPFNQLFIGFGIIRQFAEQVIDKQTAGK